MAHFGRVPFSHSEFCEGQPGDQASYPLYHFGSDGDIPLGFDRIVDEVSNEFFFYGSSHPRHHKEMFFPSDLFNHTVPDQHLHGQPLIAYGELYPGNPVSHWQQGTVSPMVGFRSSLLPDCRNFSVVDSHPYNLERELHGRNSGNSVSNVERGNINLGFQIGFDSLDAPSPVFLDNYPFRQKVREESGNGEASLTNTSRRCSIGPAQPQGSGHDREAARWSIQLIEANQGSNENTVGFCNAVEKIRNAYPAFDLKTNTGKIWSIVTRFPEHILGGTKFRISVWTDFSPHPLLLSQHAGCITHDLIVEILRHTNQYPAQEEFLLSVYGSDEFLQNNCTLGSHESLRKATTCIQLRLHHAGNLKPGLARTAGWPNTRNVFPERWLMPRVYQSLRKSHSNTVLHNGLFIPGQPSRCEVVGLHENCRSPPAKLNSLPPLLHPIPLHPIPLHPIPLHPIPLHPIPFSCALPVNWDGTDQLPVSWDLLRLPRPLVED